MELSIITHRVRLVPIFDKMIKQIYPNFESMLDVGCGPLRNSFKEYYGYKYKGLDVPNSGFPKDYIGDAHKLPKFKDNSFDLVTAWSVLEHLQNPSIAFGEMVRVARVAVIVSTDFTRQDQDGDPTHLFCWTPKVFNQFLSQSKLDVRVWVEYNILFGAVIKLEDPFSDDEGK